MGIIYFVGGDSNGKRVSGTDGQVAESSNTFFQTDESQSRIKTLNFQFFLRRSVFSSNLHVNAEE